jgi:hypothetical protein
MKHFLIILCLYTLSLAEINPALMPLIETDSVVHVWVIFADKPLGLFKSSASALACKRRQHAGFRGNAFQDAPLNTRYIQTMLKTGAVLRHEFIWANAASFSVQASLIPHIDKLPFVKTILPVAGCKVPIPQSSASGVLHKSTAITDKTYTQNAILDLYAAHAHIKTRTGELPGSGVIIGVFDEGFWLGHPCFADIVRENRVIADSDFITGASLPYATSVNHGAQTSALIGGYEKDVFTGGAYGARFILARTESDPIEARIEEDAWAAAMVWAEAQGADIVSSSLGYFGGYDTPSENYAFSDMNGSTTIISLAARAAVARGVLVVNAMGNLVPESGLLITAPADVEDVISVGAINEYGHIASFSCIGPTADGRRKPDCVAMGVRAAIPSDYGYSVNDGTSFSTPLVASVVALIRQMHPAESGAAIRNRLYRSCRFASGQDSLDNRYGRGIPDALLACIDSTDIVICATTLTGQPVSSVSIKKKSVEIGQTNELGVAVLSRVGVVLPETLMVGSNFFQTSSVIIDSLWVKKSVKLDSIPVFRITIRGSDIGRPLAGAVLNWRSSTGTGFVRYIADSSGVAVVPANSAGSFDYFAEAPAYWTTDTLQVDFPTNLLTRDIVLQKKPHLLFVVYPNVISSGAIKNNKAVSIRFLSYSESSKRTAEPIAVSIRSISGQMIWNYHGSCTTSELLSDAAGKPLEWQCVNTTGKPVVPGTYLVVVNYLGKTHLKKILITG